MTRETFRSSRQIIDVSNYEEIDFEEEVLVSLPRFAWLVARSYLSLQAQWTTSYAVEYYSNGYDTPSEAQMDTIKKNLAEFLATEVDVSQFIVGQIVGYAGSFLPDGFLWCNGQTFDALVYTELFSVIGYVYGVDSGDPKVPDLGYRFPIGANISHPRGETGGEEEHTLTVGEMPTHKHESSFYGHNDVRAPMGGGGTGAVYSTSGGRWAQIYPANKGGNNAHQNMPPYVAFPYMIYAGA